MSWYSVEHGKGSSALRKEVKDILITNEMIERKTPVFDVIAPRIEEAA